MLWKHALKISDLELSNDKIIFDHENLTEILAKVKLCSNFFKKFLIIYRLDDWHMNFLFRKTMK